MIRTLIVDDEPLAREGLATRLQRSPDVEVVGECANGREALRAILELRPDLAFLDIEMPGINGIDVVAQLPVGFPLQVVYVTAHDRYAMQAFDRAAVAYLLKPVQDARLAETLARVRKLVGHDHQVAGASDAGMLVLADRADCIRIPLSEIDYVEAAGDYMCIAAAGTTHVVRSSLKALLTRLQPVGFVRVHRSAAVNADRIRRYRSNGHGDGWVQLVDGTELKCSRSYRRAVRALLDEDRSV